MGSACPSAQLSLRGLWSCAGSGQGKEHPGEGEEQHKHKQERRLQLELPSGLCCVGPSGQGSGAGFWGGFRLSRPLPAHWFFPWTSRALEQRNKSQALLSVGFRSRLVSLCLGFSEHWDIQSLSWQNLLLEPLASCCAGCARRGSWVAPWGGRSHGIQRECPLQAREVLRFLGTRAQSPVAQSPPSTGRGHSHGAGPGLASL